MTITVNQLAFAYNKAFGNNQSIYQSFEANISEAGIYGLFGKNGSGKSTLLKLLSGLLTPTNGSIDILGFTPRQRLPEFLSQIYILPEEFHLPDLSPKELGKSHHHFYPNFSVDLFTEYLDRLDVPENQRFSQMSLGQKKKSAIAFALATCTPVLLMDEPTNGLDIVSREQFKVLMATPEQAERIVLISTHQAHDLESIISHIWFVDDGRLLLSSPMEELSKKLTMGVAMSADNLPDNVLYRESIGAQVAWVAKKPYLNTDKNADKSTDKNTDKEDDARLNIEMLYKALSLNKELIIGAIMDEPIINTVPLKHEREDNLAENAGEPL